MTGITESSPESPSKEHEVAIKIEEISENEYHVLEVSNSYTSSAKDNTAHKNLVKIENVLMIGNKEENEDTLNGTVQRNSKSKSSVNGKRRRCTEVDTVDEEETQCRVCDKEFYDVDSLANHRDYHLSHRTCCLCQKVMGNKSKLLTHHRSHTKELPYSCQVCEKRFAENSTLRKHAATHGERNFRCNVCSKAFVRKDYLAKHLLTHQQTYKCSQCGFVCHSRPDIELHIGEMHRG